MASIRAILRVPAAMLAGFLLVSISLAQPQEAVRYSNSQLGVSFQPPSGWTADNVVRYLGPEREDGTWPVLTLVANNSVEDISDVGIQDLERKMIAMLEGEGMANVQVADRRQRTIGGLNAFQMDLTYQQDGVPARQRHVYVPVAEHKRTYLFMLVDNARRFNESAPSVESAVASFTPTISRSGDTSPGTAADSGAGMWTLPLVLLGIIALCMVVGAIYLLLRKRVRA